MKKYPEIPLLKRRPEIFSVKEVIAYEKLHGSQFRLFLPLGIKTIDEIQYGSHESVYGEGGFALGGAVAQLKKNTQMLTSIMETIQSYGFGNVTMFGEAYGPGIKAKGIKYSNGSETLFKFFDIMIEDNLVTDEFFIELTNKMKVSVVTEVWRGEPTQANFDALLEKPSAESLLNGLGPENISEGVVIRSNPLLRNVFGEWLIIKHKSSKFSEVSHAPKEKNVKGITPSDIFAATYVTEGRVFNAVGRLQDRGIELTNTMVDMPILLTEIINDLHKECQPEWDADNLDEKQVKGAVSKVLAPIYKKFIEDIKTPFTAIPLVGFNKIIGD